MNLSKLFELQKAVDAQYSNVDDRLSKDILWLMEELGELVREWRGHKYRRPDNNQLPRVKAIKDCPECYGSGVYEEGIECENCNGVGDIGYYNPLLEEYTDCLSIILSIGLQTDEHIIDYAKDPFEKYKFGDVTEYFNLLFGSLYANKNREDPIEYYFWVFEIFVELGEMLGFTWDQIEENYTAKVEANKQRNC